MKRRNFLASVIGLVFGGRAAGLDQAPPVRPSPTLPQAPPVKTYPADAPTPPNVRYKTFRPPVGHTHTCRNGHTWDHQVTAGHNCPTCGLYQNVIDGPRRAVETTVYTDATRDWHPTPTGTRVVTVQPDSTWPSSPEIRYTFPQSVGGCPNGQCPTATVRGR